MNDFFNNYATAFEDRDLDALLDMYRWPVPLVTATQTVVWGSAADARGPLRALLDRYQEWQVESILWKLTDVAQDGEHHRCRVEWTLLGRSRRTFTTGYWVSGGKISAVLVVDEPAS